MSDIYPLNRHRFLKVAQGDTDTIVPCDILLVGLLVAMIVVFLKIDRDMNKT